MFNKLLVVCGPTATGKTSLAIKLAKKFNGELISADSRQIYKGMDIGTGKDLPLNARFQVPKASSLTSSDYQLGYYTIEGIKIWLLDAAKPNQEFSVSHYYRLAWQVIKRLWQEKKRPILVGGTGFYIKAIVEGIETATIPRNLPLRKRIDNWSKKRLFDYLTKLDPEKAALMNWSDKNNPYRLARAIEVSVYRRGNSFWRPVKHRKPNSLFIGLTAPLKVLYRRIDKRVEKRIKQGIEKEIKKLLAKGYSWEASALGETLGYQEWQPFFEAARRQGGQVAKLKDEIVQKWKFNEHHYARRQMTWFKKTLHQIQQTRCEQAQAEWFDITQPEFEKDIVKKIREWYSKENVAKN